MIHNNNYTNIEELPPSGFDNDTRQQITGYQPQPIDTGASKIESQTVKNVVAQREDNPYLRLTVLMGVTSVVGLFLWGVFAFISPKEPTKQIAEEPETEEIVEVEPDYQARLALRDQFHSLEKKPEPQIEQATNELPPTTKPESLPPTQPVAQPVPRPAAPRPVPRPTYRPAPKPVAYGSRNPLGQPVPAATKPEIPPQEQWLALANFGTGVSSRSIPQSSVRHPKTSPANPTPALLVNNSVSQGELGILNRRRISSKADRSTTAVTIDRGIVKGKIELPLVWDSSLTPEQQQSNQITVVLEEPIYDTEGKAIFDRGSVAICHS